VREHAGGLGLAAFGVDDRVGHGPRGRHGGFGLLSGGLGFGQVASRHHLLFGVRVRLQLHDCASEFTLRRSRVLTFIRKVLGRGTILQRLDGLTELLLLHCHILDHLHTLARGFRRPNELVSRDLRDPLLIGYQSRQLDHVRLRGVDLLVDGVETVGG